MKSRKHIHVDGATIRAAETIALSILAIVLGMGFIVSANAITVQKKPLASLDEVVFPLAFEEFGTTEDEPKRFLVRAREHTLVISPDGMRLLDPTELQSSSAPGKSTPPLAMQLIDGDPYAQATPSALLTGTVNYIRGNDRGAWRVGLPRYASLRYHQIYPGVDVAYHANRGAFEYDFIVAPGADPAQIAMRFDGATDVEIQANGQLRVEGAGHVITKASPVAYQTIDGERRNVGAQFAMRELGTVTLELESFDRNFELVIDPIVTFSTYLGGEENDLGSAVAIGSDGSVFLAGWTRSLVLPATPGSVQESLAGEHDAFVIKLTPDGQDVVYATYVGGAGDEYEVVTIAVDEFHNAHITGLTKSTDLPVTVGAPQSTYGGGIFDAFVMKLNASGSDLLYSTYVGGSEADGSQYLVLGPGNEAYVVGFTSSVDFPVVPKAAQPTHGGDWDGYFLKINVDGTSFGYGTYIGGSSREFTAGLRVDQATGVAYVVGHTSSDDFPVTSDAFQAVRIGAKDAFLSIIDPAIGFSYSTLFGGTGSDEGRDLALGADGAVYVAGNTESDDFPTTQNTLQTTFAGVIDAFALKLFPGDTSLTYSTYLGGVGYDRVNRIRLDSGGFLYIGGGSNSPDFPITGDAFQQQHGGLEDGYVSKLNRHGSSLIYSSRIGGSNHDRVRGIDLRSGDVVAAGFTGSSDLPLVASIQSGFQGGTGDCFFPAPCDSFVTYIEGLAIGGIEVSSTVQSVTAGGLLPVTIDVWNTIESPSSFIVVLLVRPLGQPPMSEPEHVLFDLRPHSMATDESSVQIPSDATAGDWELRAVLVQGTVNGPQIITSEMLPFTVN